MGQLLAAKEGHEGRGKGKDALREGLQGAFPAQRIADEHGHKIDHVIGPHAPACQAHALAEGLEGAQVGEVLRHQAHFAKPVGQGRHRERRSLDCDGPLLGKWKDGFPDNEAHFCSFDKPCRASRGSLLILPSACCHLVAHLVGTHFVQAYWISSDILPELKEKYSQWLRPEIISVRIIQKNRTVLLEIATKMEHKSLADEEIKRTDLGFIAEDTDNPLFPSERTAQENAEYFVNQFDPYSIMMCTDLFTAEGCKEVNELYKSNALSGN